MAFACAHFMWLGMLTCKAVAANPCGNMLDCGCHTDWHLQYEQGCVCAINHCANAESDMILPQEGEAARNLSIPELFGATADDADQLRIVSLVEVLAVSMCV